MIKHFLNGVFSYLKAIRVIQQQKLWGYFLAPGLISVLFMVVIATSIYFLFDDSGDILVHIWPWEWGKEAIAISGGIILALLLAGTFAFTLKYVIIIFLGNFLSPLSEKVEKSINQKEYPKPSSAKDNVVVFLRGIRLSLALISLELLITIPLFLCLLIPGAAVIVTPLIFIVQAYYAGIGNMDFVLERRCPKVRDSLKTARQHKALALGNGVIYMLLISSFIGVFFAPILSTVGITIELVKTLDKDQ